MITDTKILYVICGPTASGKTAMAITLAKKLGTEILSADSRQFYREMKIGTAAPSAEQLAEIPHHFVGHLSVNQEYNVSKYEQEALAALDRIYLHHSSALLAGGSGLYIDAVCRGFDSLPDPDPDIRKELKEMLSSEGLESLRHRLFLLDPNLQSRIDPGNPARIIRALEICMITGRPYSSLLNLKTVSRPFIVVKLGLLVAREELNRRIDSRAEHMLADGWLEEVRALYPYRVTNALNTLGYKELFSYLDGLITFDDCLAKIKTNTRRYAKRQMTWFRRDQEIRWMSEKEMTDFISGVG
jgi:tRNA dimethylallyltransferase